MYKSYSDLFHPLPHQGSKLNNFNIYICIDIYRCIYILVRICNKQINDYYCDLQFVTIRTLSEIK